MELRDELIVLRPWRGDDAEAVFAACQDPEIQRWIPAMPCPYTHDDARVFVSGALGLGPYQFAIVHEVCVVGSIGMSVTETETGRIGYWCAGDSRGRGFTTRALRVLCDYASGELGLERLELITDPENLASQLVAGKVCFRHEGALRSHLRHRDGRRRDSVMFSLLPGELR